MNNSYYNIYYICIGINIFYYIFTYFVWCLGVLGDQAGDSIQMSEDIVLFGPYGHLSGVLSGL